MLVVGFVSVAVAMIALSKTFLLSWITVVLGIAYATLSGPARWSQLFGSQGPVLLLCLAMFLVLMSKSDNPWAGVWLAIAGTLKLFPLILLGVLLARRRTRGLAGAGVTLVALNLVPLLLPNLTVASTLEALSTTASSWFDSVGNIGLVATMGRVLPMQTLPALLIGVWMVVAAWWFVMRCHEPLGASSTFLICIGILALPLAWPHYLLAAVPTVIVALREKMLNQRQRVGAAVAIAMTIPFRSTALHTAGLALMAAVLVPALWNWAAPDADANRMSDEAAAF
jgi:hypothetical protein